jgi:hypothetical protein
MNLKIRDRRYVSHDDPSNSHEPEDPQGHPPSTFLFLPMKLSNSKTVQITAIAPKRKDQNRRKHISWLPSQPNPQGSNGDASAPAAQSAATPSMNGL